MPNSYYFKFLSYLFALIVTFQVHGQTNVCNLMNARKVAQRDVLNQYKKDTPYKKGITVKNISNPFDEDLYEGVFTFKYVAQIAMAGSDKYYDVSVSKLTCLATITSSLVQPERRE